jgi:pantoate--beta-alanine ligase
MSSRNKYLSPDERTRASGISRALFTARDHFHAGRTDAAALIDEVESALAAVATRVQYVEIRDAATLEALPVVDRPAVLAVAVFLGQTRLIDNVLLG